MWQLTKRIQVALVLAGSAFFMIGCEEDEKLVYTDTVPNPPQAVFSVTGDNKVTLYWNGPYEGDIAEYAVFRSLSPTSGYVEIGRRAADYNPNLDLIIYQYVDYSAINGTTYYYAVTSIDDANQMSELSAENVFDTPRPEGEVALYDANGAPNLSGYYLHRDSVVPWNSIVADVWVDLMDSVFFLNKGRTGTDLQDMGYRDSLDGVDYSPANGWANLDFMEIIDGHTYVIWTADDHYAKMHVEQIGATFVLFTWAYQTDMSNPELVVPREEINTPMSASELNTSKDAKREYLRSRQTIHEKSSTR